MTAMDEWVESGVLMDTEVDCDGASPYVDCRLINPATDSFDASAVHLHDALSICDRMRDAVELVVNWGDAPNGFDFCGPGGTGGVIDDDEINWGP